MKRARGKKLFLLLAMAALLLTAAVGGTLAWIATDTEPLVNTFAPGSVTSEVVEDFEDNTKSNVRIKNTGDTPAYIRASIVANWCDAGGNIVEPFTDWDRITGLPGTGWSLGAGGYYYYASAVAGGDSTGNLLGGYTAPARTDGLHLEMTILCQAIQSTPTTAVEGAWGVTVGADGKITP